MNVSSEKIITNNTISMDPHSSTENFKYQHETMVTFCLTNAETNVSHDQYAKLFGIVRELFGLNMIPDFKDEAGKKYLLKTKHAEYGYKKDFFFGDVIKVEMFVKEVRAASFVLFAEFKGDDNSVHATGQQHIVYTDMKGWPKRLPQGLKNLLLSVCVTQ